METLVNFFSQPWSLGWILGVAAVSFFLLCVVFAVFFDFRWSKRYREHIPHPLDWLTVMSTERWDKTSTLHQLMNTNLGVDLFRFYTPDDYTNPPRYASFRRCPFVFYDDLCWLEDQGYIEFRRMTYDKSGREAPGVSIIVRDEDGKFIGLDRELMKEYSFPVLEYKKTSSGGRVKRKVARVQKDETLPHGVQGSHV